MIHPYYMSSVHHPWRDNFYSLLFMSDLKCHKPSTLAQCSHLPVNPCLTCMSQPFSPVRSAVAALPPSMAPDDVPVVVCWSDGRLPFLPWHLKSTLTCPFLLPCTCALRASKSQVKDKRKLLPSSHPHPHSHSDGASLQSAPARAAPWTIQWRDKEAWGTVVCRAARRGTPLCLWLPLSRCMADLRNVPPLEFVHPVYVTGQQLF